MVDYGMQLRDEGKTVDEIVEALEELKSRISINLAIDNLEKFIQRWTTYKDAGRFW